MQLSIEEKSQIGRKLADQAKENFRTPEGQAMYLLHKILGVGAEDVVIEPEQAVIPLDISKRILASRWMLEFPETDGKDYKKSKSFKVLETIVAVFGEASFCSRDIKRNVRHFRHLYPHAKNAAHIRDMVIAIAFNLCDGGMLEKVTERHLKDYKVPVKHYKVSGKGFDAVTRP